MIDEREPDTADRIEDEDEIERKRVMKDLGEWAESLLDVPENWARKIKRWFNGEGL